MNDEKIDSKVGFVEEKYPRYGICSDHHCGTDEFGDCPYCLSGELPPGMHEIPYIFGKRKRKEGD